MRATVLCCGIPADRIGKIRFLCARNKLRLREVMAGEESLPVAQIAAAPAADGTPCSDAGTWILFCDLINGQFDPMLAGLKQICPGVLKAVLTPANGVWDCARLYRELSEEDNAMKQGGTAH